MPLFRLTNMFEPGELVRFLVTANVLMFLTALLLAPMAINYTLDPSYFLSPSVNVLMKLGASGTVPVFSQDHWWTVITANYLHGSLLHLIFNALSLRSIGKITIPIFGPSRLFLIYFFGGVIAMGASSLAGIPLTLGASGAVCALIGCMSYDHWRANKGNLKMRIASVGVWVLFIAIIGLALPNVNNWAHAVGFGSGFLLGFLLWPQSTLNESFLIRVAATVCMLATISTLIYGLLFT